jgi:hypothetical protein
MASKLRVKFTLPKAATSSLRKVNRRQTVQDVIEFIGQIERADLNQISLDGFRLAPEDFFDDFYESKDQFFVFSKADFTSSPQPISPSLPRPTTSPPPTLSTTSDPPSPAGDRRAPDYVRDFRGGPGSGQGLHERHSIV